MEFDNMLAYLAALEKNNDRTWFHENHIWYESAKADFTELLELLRFTVAENAPTLSDDIMYMSVKDWMYRVAKDMRYHKNELPYDPSFRAYISRDRKSWQPIGYFLRIAPGRSCFGTGLWCENTKAANKVRDHISEYYEEFTSSLSACGISLSGDKLTKMPRGYNEDLPAAEFLKYKNWSLIADIEDRELTSFQEFSGIIGDYVKRMEPLRLFLLDAANNALDYKQIFEDFYNG